MRRPRAVSEALRRTEENELQAQKTKKQTEKLTRRQTTTLNKHLLIELPGSKYNYYEQEKKDANNLSQNI